MIKANKYYSIKEVSSILDISISTTKRHIKNSIIPSYKFGNLRKIKGSELIEYIQNSQKSFMPVNFIKLKNVNNPNSIHGIYPYRGKISAIDASSILKQLNPTGNLLDPFCGSGTIVYEAAKAGFNATGVELNPLGYNISKGKLSIEPDISKEEILSDLEKLINLAKNTKNVPQAPELGEKFFHDETIKEVLKTSLYTNSMSPYILAAFFGSIALTARACNMYKWTSSSVGKDIQPKQYINFYEKFHNKVAKHYHPISTNNSRIILGDSRHLSELLPNNFYDYIFSSPPYFNGLDYTAYYANFIFPLMGWDKELTKKNLTQHLKTYESDMCKIMQELYKVLKPGGIVIFVVGDKMVRGKLIKGSEFFEKISPFKLVDVVERSYNGTSSQVFDKLNKTKRKEQIIIWQK